MLTTEKHISPELLSKAMTWQEYWDLNEKLVAENKTTGTEQSESLLKYTVLNWTRMQRIQKTLELEASVVETVKKIDTEFIILAITEAWCGDAAQNLPAIAKIAELNPKLDFKLILRDEYPTVMDHYLTNGSRSIPKVIVLKKENLEEIGVWGPKPAEPMKLLAEFKANPEMPRDEFYKNLHTWYAKNKSVDVQYEIVELLK
ncbi:thioredoxin family protein [bacterium]|nr:MAG: thioredoxin family protein [bacterium]